MIIVSFCISGYKLFEISDEYVHEAQVKVNILKYGPESTGETAKTAKVAEARIIDTTAVASCETASENHCNLSIIEIKNEVNKDVVGWLTVPNTRIDYPVVAAKDNSSYLKRDVFGNYAEAGSIFMDCRCAKDLSCFETVIYGHNMKNGSMFGDLRLFADERFFEANRCGTLYMTDCTYTLDIIGYMVVSEDDEFVYNASVGHGELFDYVRSSALNYREPNTEENVVILSTCSYEFDGARTVLIANLHPSAPR